MSDATAILDRLALAHALLAAGRTRFALARDDNGLPVEPEAPEAVQFCLSGAVCRAVFEMGPRRHTADPLFQLVEDTFRENRRGLMTHWHDVHATDADALALLEECAARVNPK